MQADVAVLDVEQVPCDDADADVRPGPDIEQLIQSVDELALSPVEPVLSPLDLLKPLDPVQEPLPIRPLGQVPETVDDLPLSPLRPALQELNGLQTIDPTLPDQPRLTPFERDLLLSLNANQLSPQGSDALIEGLPRGRLPLRLGCGVPLSCGFPLSCLLTLVLGGLSLGFLFLGDLRFALILTFLCLSPEGGSGGQD